MKTRPASSRNPRLALPGILLATLLAGVTIECSFAQMPGASPTPAPSIRMPQDSWYLAKQIPAGTTAKLSGPSDVFVGPDGNIYVADQYNQRIQVLDSEGTVLRFWDGNSSQVPPAPGGGVRSFSPRNVHVASDGKVYVLDTNYYRVLIFDQQGKFLRAMGQYGNQEGQFSNPRGLAVDSSGNVYVGDSDYSVAMFDADGDFVRRWGSYGSSDGQFNWSVVDVQALPSGKIAVLNYGRIQVFNSDGTFDSKIDFNGSLEKSALSLDGSGNFYILGRYYNYSNSAYYAVVQKLSNSGGLIAEFDFAKSLSAGWSSGFTVAGNRIYIANNSTNRINVVSDAGDLIANWGVQGSASTASVFGLAVDASGNTFVAEADRNEIRKYDTQLNLLKRFGSAGSGNGEFSGLRDLAVGSNNRLYALEQGNSRVQIFDLEGNYVGKFGLAGTANGRFQVPSGIAVGKDNKIYVADRDNHRVQIFDANGNFLGKFGQEGSFDGEFKSPYDVATYPNGDVAVADYGNKRIQIFDHEGKFLRKRNFSDMAREGGMPFGDDNGGRPEIVHVGCDGLLYATAAVNGSSYIYSPTYRQFLYNGYPTVVADGQLKVIKIWWPSAPVTESNSSTRYNAPNFVGPFAESSTGNLMAVNGDGQLRVWNRTSRTVQPEPANAVPLPSVVSQQRRPGTSLVDVDYTVKDADNVTVHTAALAFKDGGNSLNDLIPITSLVGDSTLGANTATGSTHRFTWDAGQDLNTDFSEVQFEILAKDARELLNLSFIQIPAMGDDPALKISISPLNDSDFLSVWYWLIATGDSSIRFADGKVTTADGSVGNVPGILGEYFPNADFTGTSVSRIDQTPISPTYNGNDPIPGIPFPAPAIRWSGDFVPAKTGSYAFSVNATGKLRVTVGGNVALDGSYDYSWASFNVSAQAGVPISIVIEISQNPSSWYGATARSVSFNVTPPGESYSRDVSSADFQTVSDILATGATTTGHGREFIFEKMGLRQATAAEVLRAKEAGNPGAAINQWDPKLRVGPDERPAKINAYGFDTGGSGYWVVPVNNN